MPTNPSYFLVLSPSLLLGPLSVKPPSPSLSLFSGEKAERFIDRIWPFRRKKEILMSSVSYPTETEPIMAGTDDDSSVIEFWSPSNRSSRTLPPSLSNEAFGSSSFSDFLAENGNGNVGPLWKSETQRMGTNTNIEGNEAGVSDSNGFSLQPRLFGSSTPGGLAERMATRKGFQVPKLDTACIPPAGMASQSDVGLPYLTIPPGLSPTMLLESPVFLSDPMVQLFSTTGKFKSAEDDASNSMLVSNSAASTKSEDYLFEDNLEAFAFKPPPESHSHLSTSGKKPQELPGMEVSTQPEKPTQAGSIEADKNSIQNQQEFHLQAGFYAPSDRKDTINNTKLNQRMFNSLVASHHSPAVDDQHDGEGDLRGELSAAAGTPAEDGYNWRKYGQKQVKGCEYPRSYYKCTQPNCQVKKKVERSHEGHITEIIYKGAHNHPKPHLNRRPGIPSSHPFNDAQIDSTEQPGSQTNCDGKPAKGSSQSGNGGQDWLVNGLEATSSAPAAAEQCDPSNSLPQNQDGTRLSSDVIGVSSTMSNDEEDDDRATHGSVSLGCDGEGDETESKRRKIDACAIEMSAASRAVREPRVVVQTTSEVDILDDGYRWRKYGQKVVKGNPNPRSYYKCTNPGCIVRKHIERASHDLKSVITTYEGKHNHDVPVARSSSHPNSAPSSNPNSDPQPHSLLQRSEPTQDNFVRFDGHAPLGTFRFPGREQLGPATSCFPFALGQPGLTNLAMAGLGPMAAMKMPVIPPVHPYLGRHHPAEAGYMMHKIEPKEESAPDSVLPVPPNATSVYHQMMSRLPLGPHL
uniref:WRKY domain-containing protein n=2 Tax=Musa acuminata subsp. malaccensis TaxID=214687 RepID=A0A804J0M9_MUSAM|nr:PREDICTED: probable WRKY transcription factor 2 [Musa acuminata subsp. malaccensis]